MNEPIPTNGTEHLFDVFVIGAGASVPYGLPTGLELIQNLRDDQPSVSLQGDLIPPILSPGSLPVHYLDSEDWIRSEYATFHDKWKRQIQGSVILTIDQFLKNRPDKKLAAYGKALMAYRVLAYEKDSIYASAKDRDGKPKGNMKSVDWIQYFLTQVDLQPNWEAYLKSSTFISFNYDRVLEYFLRQFLLMERSKSIEEAEEFIASMNIYHLNGYLGPLKTISFGNVSGEHLSEPWRELYDKHRPDRKEPDYLTISRNMRTVWESEAHSDRDLAQVAIGRAKRIFVLGTSYIPENLDAIGLGPLANSNRANLRGTTHGLSDAQIDRSAKLLGIRPKEAILYLPKVTCKDLVIDEVVL